MIVTCQYKNHQIDTANDGSVPRKRRAGERHKNLP